LRLSVLAIWTAALLMELRSVRATKLRFIRWIKDRAKTSYYLRRCAGSLVYHATRDILKVRDFLRHASVGTNHQWYTYLLEDVPLIGMNDLFPVYR